MKRPPATLNPGPPCPACAADHAIHACNTEEAARILDDAGQPMSAHRVRERFRHAAK